MSSLCSWWLRGFGNWHALLLQFPTGRAGLIAVAARARGQASLKNEFHGAVDRNADNAGAAVDPAVAVQLGIFARAKLFELRRRRKLQVRDVGVQLGRCRRKAVSAGIGVPGRRRAAEPLHHGSQAKVHEQAGGSEENNDAKNPFGVDVTLLVAGPGGSLNTLRLGATA